MKWKSWMVLPLLLIGCGLMKSLGLADEAGNPTDMAKAADAVVAGTTGISPLTAIGLWKAGEALFTKRGLENGSNVLNPQSSWKSTLWSLLALVVGSHTPEDAKGEQA